MPGQLPIAAGEIEKYAYCPLNWWLYREGVGGQGRAQAEGQDRHRDLAEDLTSLLRTEAVARQWETLVLYFALAASAVAVFGVTLLNRLDLRFATILSVLSLIWLLAATYLMYRADHVARKEERFMLERLLVAFAMVATLIALLSLSLLFVESPDLAAVVEVVALTWLVGASFFLYKALLNAEAARRVRAEEKLGTAPITYVDAANGGAEVLVSEAHGLSGRPDFILQEEETLIPVEVKTGRKPRGPLFSHILQLTAYCFLVEEARGVRPPYGLLRYGDQVHEIDYTDDLRGLLLAKLREMRDVAARREAHRNHNRPGKCAHCSRRHACPERLA